MPIETLPTHDPVAEQGDTVIRQCLERVYSKGELYLVDRLVAADCVGETTDSSVAVLGVSGFKAHVVRLRNAVSGFTLIVDAVRTENGRFEASWTARGTHEQRFLGIEPTCTIGLAGEEPHGKAIVVSGTTTGTITDGTIETFRMVWDEAELRQQLTAAAANDDLRDDSFESDNSSAVVTGSGSNAVERALERVTDPTSVGLASGHDTSYRNTE